MKNPISLEFGIVSMRAIDTICRRRVSSKKWGLGCD